MNQARRDKIEVARANLNNIFLNLQSESKKLDKIWDEEVESYEGRPEGLKMTDSGYQSSDAIEMLENVSEQLEESIYHLAKALDILDGGE